MADLRDDSTQQIFRIIIREEIKPLLEEEVPAIVRKIVREETVDMRQDIITIKNVQSQQGMQLREINSGLASIKTTLRHHGSEIRRTAVLLEDLDDRFKAAAEIS